MLKPLFATLLFNVAVNFSFAQHLVNKVQFFTDTAMVTATLKLDVKKLIIRKDVPGQLFPATFSCKMADSLNVNDQIAVEVRGHFRRAHCYLPPLKLIYRQNPSCAFYNFKDLKLVNSCMPSRTDDQNLLKEYLTYKIYNLLTDKSFRVRLLRLSYVDSGGKRGTITEHAFLVEDVKDLASRNHCKLMKNEKIPTRSTDRNQMVLASVFEYMIGNTDWSVPENHNIRLIKPKHDQTGVPFMVPYDFDFSGLVNTDYALPDERMGLKTVRTRLYRGAPVSKDELIPVLDYYNQKKAAIYAAINGFDLLSGASKKEMTDYLDEFYATINDRGDVRSAFALQ
jgi:hypothetical protein